MRRFLRKHWQAVLLLGFGAGFLLAGALFLWAATLRVPDLASLESRRVEQSTKIYDRTGTVLLYSLNNSTNRTVVPLSQISQNIQNATIAIEDPGFYGHYGIDAKAIARAVLVDITTLSASQGGSTITQQVVKMTLLTGAKNVTRKVE